MAVHVKCKNKACGRRVALDSGQCRELWRSLRVAVTCPGCATAFVKEVVAVPRERPAPAVVAPAIPLPAGADKRPPPFRPLTPAVTGGPPPRPAPRPPQPVPTPPPPTDTDPAGAVVAPFAPIPFGRPAGGGAKSGGPFGRWNRLPKRKQSGLLALGLALAVAIAGAVQLRPHLTPARVDAARADAATQSGPAPPPAPAAEPGGDDETDLVAGRLFAPPAGLPDPDPAPPRATR